LNNKFSHQRIEKLKSFFSFFLSFFKRFNHIYITVLSYKSTTTYITILKYLTSPTPSFYRIIIISLSVTFTLSLLSFLVHESTIIILTSTYILLIACGPLPSHLTSPIGLLFWWDIITHHTFVGLYICTFTCLYCIELIKLVKRWKWF
jgi:hypothetical protein